MNIEYIRKTFGVPAKIGGRIKFTDAFNAKWFGKITSVRNGQLRILVDDRIPNYRGRLVLHPTNNVEYI